MTGFLYPFLTLDTSLFKYSLLLTKGRRIPPKKTAQKAKAPRRHLGMDALLSQFFKQTIPLTTYLY